MLEFDARDAAAAAAAAAAWERETGTETEMEGMRGATRMTVRKEEEEEECVLAAVLSSLTCGRVWYW